MVGKKTQQAFQRVLFPRQKEKQAFLDRLGKNYPEPRAELEWIAYDWLRQWWSGEKIQEFLKARNADEMKYPGIIDTPKGPKIDEFIAQVDLLAVGECARKLPKTEMLEMVAGREAAHGGKFGSPPVRRDLLSRAIKDAREKLEFEEPESKATWRNILDYIEKSDDCTFIQEIDRNNEKIHWRNAAGKEFRTRFKTFRNRCSNS
jgi:hypothetical protein